MAVKYTRHQLAEIAADALNALAYMYAEASRLAEEADDQIDAQTMGAYHRCALAAPRTADFANNGTVSAKDFGCPGAAEIAAAAKRHDARETRRMCDKERVV